LSEKQKFFKKIMVPDLVPTFFRNIYSTKNMIIYLLVQYQLCSYNYFQRLTTKFHLFYCLNN